MLADLLIVLLSIVLIVRSFRVDHPVSILYVALLGACVCGVAEAKLWQNSWKLHLGFFCLPVIALVSWDLLQWRHFVEVGQVGEASIGMTVIAVPTILFFGPLAGIALWRKGK